MNIGKGWRRLFRFPSPEREIDDEIAFHLEMREERLRLLGEPAHAAHERALAQFGDPARARQDCIAIQRDSARRQRWSDRIETFFADLRLAFRSLRKSPSFTAVAVATLAIGIGGTSAMFSLVDGILLRPLPYPDEQRLVSFRQSYPEIGLDAWGLTQENVAMYRDQVRELAAFAGYSAASATLASGKGDPHPERLDILRATGDFFGVLGVPPLIGHTFGRAEDIPSGDNVAVLSYGFWQSHFAGEHGVLDRTIDLDGVPTRVIGVMPDGFSFPRPGIRLWIPLHLDPTRRFGWFLTGVGRLAPGATVGQLRQSSTSIMWAWARTMPVGTNSERDPSRTRMATLVAPLHDTVTGDTRRPLAALQAAVILMLLIALANVATLLSSRSVARSAEIAVRCALGATSGRIVRQLLTESVALASLGGAAGIALAFLIVRAVTHTPTISLPRISEVSVNGRVLVFTAGVAIAAGLAFGLAPAIGLARDGLSARLAAGTRESARRFARRFNNVLIVGQLGLAAMLVISAGLVVKSFQHLLATDLGFDSSHVTTIGMPFPAVKYADRRRVVAPTNEIVERVRAIHGVTNAAIAWTLPFGGNFNSDGYLIEGRPAPPTGMEGQTVEVAVGPGYFGTLHMPLRYGRDFLPSDRDSTPSVAIVDEEFAHRYWTGEDAIGKRFRLTGDPPWFTIVGVVGSVRDQDAATAPIPHSYFPFAQVPDSRPMLILRTGGDATVAIASTRRIIADVEPGVPLDNVRPLDSWISNELNTRRMTEWLFGGFALVAALLAAVGIYGVLSLYVSNRRREFGIRLAIGAEPGALVRLVLAEGVGLAAAGVALGVVGAFVAGRWLRALLFEVSPTDPTVYVAIAIAMLVVAAGSSFIPARRAARSDPIAALRAE